MYKKYKFLKVLKCSCL